MKTLILGGTGFIGRRLVSHLMKAKCEVTIATSGKTPNYFGDEVSTIIIDRFNSESMKAGFPANAYYDIVFDQIGFGPDDISKVLQAFDGKIGHYIFTSSAAVYVGLGRGGPEENFDPASVEPRQGGIEDLGYPEGKRSAEAYLFREASFPFAVARFPIVIGPDDTTGRLQFHINRILNGQEIVIPSPSESQNYVWVDDAGRFLSWLGLNHKVGIYNGASSPRLDATELVEEMGRILGRKPKIMNHGEKSAVSPYYLETEIGVDVAKAENDGFHFTPFGTWFENVVRETAATGGKTANSMDYLRKRARSRS